MIINTNELKNKADILFWIYEKTQFKNQGNYPRKTNLVIEFADYLQNARQEDLEQYVSFSSPEEFQLLKKMINEGIDVWLDAGDLKTLLLSD